MKLAYLSVHLLCLVSCQAAPCGVFICNVNVAALAQSRFESNLLDPRTCQTVILEYATSENNELRHHRAVTQFYPMIRDSRRQFNNFKALIEVKTDVISNGENFNTMFLIQETRSIFIQSCIDYLRYYELDGISVKHTSFPQWFFKNYFLKLLQEMNDAFVKESETTGRPKFLLYIVLSTKKYIIENFYDIPTMFRLADIVKLDTHFFSYSLTETWLHRHHSRIYGNNTYDELNIDYIVTYFLSRGALKSKLTISIAFFGYLFVKMPLVSDYRKRYARYYVVESFTEVQRGRGKPDKDELFLIYKGLKTIVGEPKSVSRLHKSSELLVEVH
uniref:GH18 domain-containing protein n=1 Tax=Biomphalaria glabrata TaxID=6526 RepID=A0A2C9M467_BIOGL